MNPVAVVEIHGTLDVYEATDRADAITFAGRMARKRRKWYTVSGHYGRWQVYEYMPSEWQGWHYTQIRDRHKYNHEMLVATPAGILTADRVPVVFEDGNNPGWVFLGDCHQQAKLEANGGVALPVCESRIRGNGSYVFVNGPEFMRPDYVGDPDYGDIAMFGSDPYDWELVEVVRL